MGLSKKLLPQLFGESFSAANRIRLPSDPHEGLLPRQRPAAFHEIFVCLSFAPQRLALECHQRINIQGATHDTSDSNSQDRRIASRRASLRPSLAIANTVQKYQSRIEIQHGPQVADGRYVLELMLLAAVKAGGVDSDSQRKRCRSVLAAIADLLGQDFELQPANLSAGHPSGDFAGATSQRRQEFQARRPFSPGRIAR